jgi:DNA-binding transcriptional LysR family regulator
MSDRITSMAVFRAVAELGGFARAARSLRLSNAAVSKHVASLERDLGVRLLQRTTRAVSLTAIGRAYLERGGRILDDLAALDAEVRADRDDPRGLVKVSAPNSWGLVSLAPALPALLARWPALEVELSLTDRFVDLVEEGYDIALRVATQMPDSSLVAVQVARYSRVLVASPAYLRRRGLPRRPADLAGHVCLRHARTRERDRWTLAGPGGEESVTVRGPFSVDNSLALRDALLGGVGIALTPSFVVDRELRAGRLRTVLPGWSADDLVLSAVYPATRGLSARVRAFVDFIRERFGPARPARAPSRARRLATRARSPARERSNRE